MRGGVTGILLLLLAALVAVVAAEVTLGGAGTGAAPAATPPVPEAPREIDLPEFALPPLESLSETVERPLFAPDRRPPPEPVAGALEESPAAADVDALADIGPFVLSAIVIDEDSRVALLRDPSTGKLEQVTQGNSISGWRLDRVEPSAVTFTRNGEERNVELRRFEPAPAPEPAAAKTRARPRSTARNNRRPPRATASAPRRPTAPRSPGPARGAAGSQSTPEPDCGLSRC